MTPQLSRRIVLTKLAESSSEKDLRDALHLHIAPLSSLEPGKIRVKIQYASLNFADVLVVQGKYQEKPSLPSTLGSECSGTVVEVHPTLNDSKYRGSISIGQRVLVICTTNMKAGAYADFIDVYPWQTFPIPYPQMKMETAAGFAVAAGTAHIALVDRANVNSGDLVVITGASGGTGMYACLIAKALGCKVVATARGKTKVNFVKSLLGPDDFVIDIATTKNDNMNEKRNDSYQKIVDTVLKMNKMGAQVIYDTVGGSLFKYLLKCARWKCRLCVVGFAAGGIPNIPSNILLVKNSSVVGVYWGNYFRNERNTILESMNSLFSLICEGKLNLGSVPIHEFQWELVDLPLALSALSKGETYGKVLIKCSNSDLRKNYLRANL